MTAAWFEKDPERYRAELHYLEKAGFKFNVDQKALEAGQLQITVMYSDEEHTHNLTVIFPSKYPYFPFRIFAPTFPPGRHIDPYGFDLCFFANLQNKWDGIRDTLAGVLQEQVPKVLYAHRHEQNASLVEVHEAQRPSGYLAYMQGGKILVGDWQIPANLRRGKMKLALDPGCNPNECLRGAALALLDEQGKLIGETDLGTLQDIYSDSQKTKHLKARWVRLDAAPKRSDVAILDEAFDVWPDLKTPVFDGGPDIVGLIFPEEQEYRGRRMETWAFVVRSKTKINNEKRIRFSRIRSDVLSKGTIQARVPRTTPIAEKRILLVGLGALGAPMAWQLARAGVGALNCLDHDFVQIGNLPRWLMGVEAVGLQKADAVPRYLMHHYPYLNAKGFNVNIGSVYEDDDALLEEAIAGVDLIIDATAEWAVNLYLSDLARERGLPYIWATGTPGSWGGTVGRVIPNQTTGCWYCFQCSMYEGAIPTPSQEEGSDIQPQGCFHPTFTGTGFDMDHVTLMATRLAVATLCSAQSGGYPDFDWNVGVLSLWDQKTAMPIAPKWQTCLLKPHPHCPYHG